MFSKERQTAIEQLEQLASQVNAEQLFTACFLHLGIRPLDGESLLTVAEKPLSLELLAYWLYPKFSASARQGMPSCIQIEECLESIHALAKTEGLSNIDHTPVPEGQPQGDDTFELSAYMKLHSTYLRGSAYAEQTAEEIRATQGRFEEWFKRRAGIGPSRAVELVLAIGSTEERALRAVLSVGRSSQATSQEQQLSQFESQCRIFDAMAQAAVRELPVAMSSIDPALAVSREEWLALGRLIGCTQEARRFMKHVQEIARHPLYVLSEDRFLLANVTSAFDELQAAYETLARADEKFYQKYQKHQANAIQQQVVNSLSNLFPPSAIFSTLDYPDPDHPASTTELDVLVDWPPFLFLIEVKAKQIRRQSALGDLVRLRSDLRSSIEDAFGQGLRALKYVQSTERPRFIERETRNPVEIDTSRMKRIYLMAVSQHDVSQLSAMLHRLHPMGLFREGEYPWALSVAILETITRFCPGPEVFAHYADRRIDGMRRSTVLRGDELEYFGFYLESRLIHVDSLLTSVMGESSYLALMGYQHQFDLAMSYQRGHVETPPNIKLNVPAEVRAILGELRRRDTPEDRWVAFCILSMTFGELKELADAFLHAKASPAPGPGFFSCATHRVEDLTISIVSTVDLVPELLKEPVQSSLSLDKYRQRTTRGIGFGLILRQNASYFECVAFIDAPWKYDSVMEELLKAEEAADPTPRSYRPGRNSPCPCGSGKKYKHCCITRR
ncbi:hypothetical protein CYFUS_006972 [Cystobacter fuscus]|uniref:Preprotein translocase subunit SecA n=1 Tax=Cystobacter fuscus TaxID=43 RepID=A0A250JEB4_9BACT|nr:SEC-C domain-containing protein [Cystobacter fuscus]ATB41506.1 hypothetical protein CYFUS_006972 [Cystobacter fuscus]